MLSLPVHILLVPVLKDGCVEKNCLKKFSAKVSECVCVSVSVCVCVRARVCACTGLCMRGCGLGSKQPVAHVAFVVSYICLLK